MKSIQIYISAFFLIALFQNNSRAQQTSLFPEYNYNPFIINSAYTGMASGSEATFSNYGYLNNVEGSPKSLAFSFHSPLSEGKMGLGGAILRDKIGVTTNTSAYVAYSYKIFFDFKSDRPYWQIYDQNVLSFGLTAGVHQLNEDLLDLGIISDPAFSENVNATIPAVGVGVLYNCASFYAGVSAPNILGDRLASRNDLNLSNPVYGYFGYRFFTNQFEEIMIKPSAFLKYEEGAPMQLDINLAANFKNKVEVGAGYRSSSSVNFLGGIYALKGLKFVYYYNLGFKDSLLGNSHGLVVSYTFNHS
ncbi:PorP/SprF family type IX secretion system membrane protein [Zhouia spongiae]|uniref:PorP/SprF family type IX secretion system membrane protein n=1 Tax=Zhouia spongiae TaxID=2202721 RepID=A0ABY3YK06_9FLAO|nr:PorP/SprF family type IX secretion system membrane protein [Zhouia spongiae]UNY97930.1 PorP/SprF family type IX secretion system membrane protein [Zhouia spongiae]